MQLPTGRIVELATSPRDEPPATGPAPAGTDGPLFARAIALFDSGSVVLRADGARLDVRSVDLRDFHALRAITTRLGWLDEEPIEIACRNCDRPIEHRPCGALELGPFVDRELTNPILDVTLDLGSPHAIPEVRLAKARARDIMLRTLRVQDALPLFAALGRRGLRVTSQVVLAMGISRIGGEESASKMARALERASEEAWSAVTNLYLEAHYCPRLFSIAMCPDCGARNDVDAPYDREFDYTDAARPAERGSDAMSQQPNHHPRSRATRTNGEVFPTFEAFAERARTVAEGMFEERGLHAISLIAEGGVPACDDGGEPLLGSYLPPDDGDAANPSRSAEVTVYYRTFRSMWEEDGPFDWDEELRETVEHELSHHEGHLAGDDPMDDEERRQIAVDAAEIVGRRAMARGAIFGLYRDLGDFARRTWPIWLLALIVTVVAAMGAR